MKTVVQAGVILGVAVALWTVIFLFAGMHTDPMTALIFYFVILMQAAVLFWGLRQTAAQGNTYGRQVVAGLSMSAISAVIIFIASFTITAYIFPNNFVESETGLRTFLENQGASEAEIRVQIETAAAMHTPLMNALMGVIGTMTTGLLFSLILAAFLKAKPGDAAGSSADERAS